MKLNSKRNINILIFLSFTGCIQAELNPKSNYPARTQLKQIIQACHMPQLSDLLKNLFFLTVIGKITSPAIKHLIAQSKKGFKSKTKVAELRIGDITDNSTYYRKHLERYFKNNEIRAILLRIDSPGGAAGSAEAIANEIAYLKKQFPKPIITIVENICASGGYYIAAATDHIISNPSALIGSIGAIIPSIFNVNKALKYLHIDYYNFTGGKCKSAGDPFAQFSDDQKQMIQDCVDTVYENFKKAMVQYRPQLTLATAENWSEGKIFTGHQAMAIGLIDQIGSESNAIEKIKELALIEGGIEWVKPKPTKSGPLTLLAKLFRLFSEDSSQIETTSTGSISTVISSLLNKCLHSTDLIKINH